MHRADRLTALTRAACAVAALLALSPAAHAQDAGFGSDIPLELAAKRIVPPDYKVQLGDGVDSKASVSWSNGEDGWRKALSSAAQSAGYVATVSDNTVRIVRAGAAVERVKDSPADKIERAPAKVREARAEDRRSERRSERSQRRERRTETRVTERRVIEQDTVSGGGFVLVKPRVEKVSVEREERGDWKSYKDAPAAEPVKAHFVVQTGDDLHRTLIDWAEREGWRLVWSSEYQYRLTSAAKFDGTFQDATTELLRSLSEARPVVTAKFYEGNKTLVVGNGSLDEAN